MSVIVAQAIHSRSSFLSLGVLGILLASSNIGDSLDSESLYTFILYSYVYFTDFSFVFAHIFITESFQLHVRYRLILRYSSL